jgi:hypothetical protein
LAKFIEAQPVGRISFSVSLQLIDVEDAASSRSGNLQPDLYAQRWERGLLGQADDCGRPAARHRRKRHRGPSRDEAVAALAGYAVRDSDEIKCEILRRGKRCCPI